MLQSKRGFGRWVGRAMRWSAMVAVAHFVCIFTAVFVCWIIIDPRLVDLSTKVGRALLGFLLSVALFAAIRGFVVSVPLTLLGASSFVNRRSLSKAILLAMAVAALFALAMLVAGVTHPLLMSNANDDPMSLHFLEPTLSFYLWFMPVVLAIFIPALLWLWTCGFLTSRKSRAPS